MTWPHGSSVAGLSGDDCSCGAQGRDSGFGLGGGRGRRAQVQPGAARTQGNARILLSTARGMACPHPADRAGKDRVEDVLGPELELYRHLVTAPQLVSLPRKAGGNKSGKGSTGGGSARSTHCYLDHLRELEELRENRGARREGNDERALVALAQQRAAGPNELGSRLLPAWRV